MKHKPRDINQTVGVVEIDAATVTRWRRKARRAVPLDPWRPMSCHADAALALARDLLRVLDGHR